VIGCRVRHWRIARRRIVTAMIAVAAAVATAVRINILETGFSEPRI